MKNEAYTLAFVAVMILTTSCVQNENNQPGNRTSEISVDTLTKSEIANSKLDSSKYEILTTDHQPAVENYYILLKTTKQAKASLQDFIDKFRQAYCTRKCNISLYDDKTIKSLVIKYPLGDKEYLKVADHFIGQSTFDNTEVWLYPFQDIKYKELGGKNWKKKPIK